MTDTTGEKPAAKSTAVSAPAKKESEAAPAAETSEPTVAAPEGVVDTGSTKNATGNRATLDDIARQVAESRK